MVALRILTRKEKPIRIAGELSGELLIRGVAIDSRAIEQDFLFVAIKGVSTDGHHYITQAIQKGARVICCEDLPAQKVEGIVYLQYASSARSGGKLIAAFYNNPSDSMKVIGITGTNGKTSVATLAFQTLRHMGYSCGLISTVEVRVNEDVLPATHTTPDVVSLQKLLRLMADQGCAYVLMEVSSHAADQDRIAGIRFEGAVFTNMSHDHLDYHKTFDAYIKAKKKFFDQLDTNAFALVNIDDKRGPVMVQNCVGKHLTYALRQLADFKARVIANTPDGLELDIDGQKLYSHLSGVFNAYNLLAVYGLCSAMELPKIEVLQAISLSRGASGRMQKVQLGAGAPTVIVDYAHTPDALENVLKTIHSFRTSGQKIFCVVGCGGDRDKTKRPVMAKVAVQYADRCIFTADNPRSERAEDILAEMMQGVDESALGRVLQIADRKSAIQSALMLGEKDAIILIAGKGHENYQEIQGVKYPFDDINVTEEIYRTMRAN